MANYSSSFTVIPLSPTHLDEATMLYSKTFITDEPTTRHYALDVKFFYPFAQRYLQYLIRKDLSFVALDRQNQHLIGFIFAFDMTDNLIEEDENMAPFLNHFKEAIIMINELEMKYLLPGWKHPGTTVHIFQIGLSSLFRGQKIAQAMIHHLIDHARSRGFIRMIADCTHAASVAAFERCGFSRQGFLPYDTFMINGEPFFVGLEGGISLMIREF